MEAQHESAQRLYDRRAQVYDDSWHPAFAKHFVEIAELKPGEDVLDLACGTGLVTFNAAAVVGREGHVTGVDISTGMLQQALAKMGPMVSNVEIYQHDITQLDSLDQIQGRTFDVITIASAIVLLDDPKEAIRKWATFLKPGGRFVVDVISPHNMPTGLVFERTGRRLGLKVPYYRDWVKSAESVTSILEEAGLHVEKLIPVAQDERETKFLDISDAEMLFDKEINSEAFKKLAASDVKDRARAVFREEWEKIAVDGKIKSEDLVWVAVARRPG